ncbi:MAG: sigma-70 family RNA polymerase sigma factor [Planctomycetes bacterium]|nr:sigma-70 family RNA polymerase sigma factor [Planctomycetota bacterium]
MAQKPEETDQRARFDQLSARYREEALRFIRLKLGATLRRRLDSEDVLQEALLEASALFCEDPAIARMGELEFFSWLKRVIGYKVQNLARYFIGAKQRSVLREESLTSRSEHQSQAKTSKTPSALQVEEELAQQIQEAMDLLSPREREVVDLVHLKKMRVADAAARLGKTTNATSVLLSQALKKLVALLQKKGDWKP